MPQGAITSGGEVDTAVALLLVGYLIHQGNTAARAGCLSFYLLGVLAPLGLAIDVAVGLKAD